LTIDQIRLTENWCAKSNRFFRKLVTVTEIKMLAEIKEAKQYKGLKLILNEELVTFQLGINFANI
jgi:recombinational DNA repair protein RecR